MYRLVIAALLMVGLLFAGSTAQEIKKVETKKEEKLPKTTGEVKTRKVGKLPLPGEVEISFLNGSTVRMIVHSDKLDIATQYGKLSVPVTDVRSIDFGLHFPDEVADKIDVAMKNLGSSDYREREKAGAALIELGPFSYPAVLAASRIKDSEVSQRAKDLVKKLQANHPKKDLKTSIDDKVVTPNFTVVGRILTPIIKAKTEYFGEVELSLAKMRTLRSLFGPTLEMDVTVDAAKYANQGQWMETEFEVDGRTPLLITAKGLVDALPQQPGQGVSGPNGIQAIRNGQPGIVFGGRKIGRVVNINVHGGMLLGKIGESGDFFIIGERYEGTPEQEGKLYLHIGPSQWQCQSMGTYDVKIMRKPG